MADLRVLDVTLLPSPPLKIFYCGKIHITKFTVLNCVFSGSKYI